MLARSHSDKEPEMECSYCNGKRRVDNVETGENDLEESGVKYHKLGFTTTKMRAEDLERCLNQGFTRCGTYVYLRSSHKSCCEIYQYRVNIDDFKMSHSHKKVVRRFHKYLNYGSIHGEEEAKENEQDKQESPDQVLKEEMAGQASNNLKKDLINWLKSIIETKVGTSLHKEEGVGEFDKIKQSHKVTFNSK